MRGSQPSLDGASLVASGEMTLPRKKFDAERFWSIGGSLKGSTKLKKAIQQAIAADREEAPFRLRGSPRRRDARP